MEGCVFCALRQHGKERLLFEDSTCFVVPDRNPVEKGHLLVISNMHYLNMLEAPDEISAHMFVIAKRFGLKLCSTMGAEALNISTNIGKEAGQAVFHFHIHVVPRYSAERNKGQRGKQLSDAEFAALK
jgi:histidine triad (HIT) family protein